MDGQRASLASKQQSFSTHNEAALALLSAAVQAGIFMERKAGSFLGTCAVLPEITGPMQHWLGVMLAKAGLPAVDPAGM